MSVDRSNQRAGPCIICDMGRSKGNSDPGPVGAAAVIEAMADGVFTVDADHVITSFNRAAERITGFSAKEAVGQTCYDIFRSQVCRTGCLLVECVRRGGPVTGFETAILNRQNDEVPVSVSTAVLRDEAGEIVGGVVTFRDLACAESMSREVRRQYAFHNMLSKNSRMQAIFELIPDIAASNATVLIQGETGTGKEPLAQAIHNKSPRCDGTFITVNCGALPDALLESELFGHVPGAFTDARAERIGRFELANNGTIFLDEVGDTSPVMQVKLLRVLQEGMFEPVGSSQTRSANVRVIAATNHDLKKLAEAGRFRKDLYYRINTVMIELPPLRERHEDIPMLVEHFIERYNGLTGKRVRMVERNAMKALMRYPWPGNVRELEHAIEHAFILTRDSVINSEHLPEEVSRSDLRSVEPTPAGPPKVSTLADAERQVIEAVLERHRWSRSDASRELGMSRSTLWRKMKKLGLLPE